MNIKKEDISTVFYRLQNLAHSLLYFVYSYANVGDRTSKTYTIKGNHDRWRNIFLFLQTNPDTNNQSSKRGDSWEELNNQNEVNNILLM